MEVIKGRDKLQEKYIADCAVIGLRRRQLSEIVGAKLATEWCDLNETALAAQHNIDRNTRDNEQKARTIAFQNEENVRHKAEIERIAPLIREIEQKIEQTATTKHTETGQCRA